MQIFRQKRTVETQKNKWTFSNAISCIKRSCRLKVNPPRHLANQKISLRRKKCIHCKETTNLNYTTVPSTDIHIVESVFLLLSKNSIIIAIKYFINICCCSSQLVKLDFVFFTITFYLIFSAIFNEFLNSNTW